MLWDPAAHEPLVQDAWDEVRTRAAIRAIVAGAEDAYDDGWPPHPDDAGPGDPGPWGGLYLGGAGVVDALRRLAERGFVELRRDYLPYVDTLEPESAGPSLLMGETGVLLVRHRLEPSAATLGRLRELVAANVGDAHRELLWGSPGTMLVARELGFDDLWLHSSERLLAAREPETELWTQNLYGDELQYLGAAHGFAGCVLALGDVDGAAATARRHAVLEDGLANWPPLADGVLVRNGTVRVQWCHGAPGMITSLVSNHDERDSNRVDRRPPADLAVLDHVDADGPRAQAEPAAAVVLGVASAAAPAADPGDRDHHDLAMLDRLAEDSAHRNGIASTAQELVDVHSPSFVVRRSRKPCTPWAAASLSIDSASQSRAWPIVPCQARSRKKSNCCLA
jgi:hypothetical protein